MTMRGIWSWLYARASQFGRAFLALFPWSRHNWPWIVTSRYPFLCRSPCSKHFDGFIWDPYSKAVAGFGNTGIIERLDCGHVRKCAMHPDDRRFWLERVEELQREYEVYQRIGTRPGILQMIEFSLEKGILILQALPGGTLRDHLSTHPDTPISQRLLWAVQMADAVQTLHSSAVLHCDIKPSNVLLDDSLRAYLIDFAGSVIDGKQALIMEDTRFRLPCDYKATLQTDMFALGSSIFEIMTGNKPYEDIENDDEVEQLFKSQTFPDTTSIVCGDAILKCWRSEYSTVGEVRDALDKYYHLAQFA